MIDTSAPIVTGVNNNGVYDSKSGEKYIYFDKGNGALNGTLFISGGGISKTGSYTLVVTANNITTVNFTYIKYGDVTGDGAVDIIDLVLLKKHLLKIRHLIGAFMIAGDIDSKGNISLSDLLAVKKHLLGISLIS